MMVYKSLATALKGAELAKERRDRKISAEDTAWKNKVKEWKKNEKGRTEEKRVLSGKILAWTKGFAQSPEHKRARKFLENDVPIFRSGWGHELPQYSENPEQPSRNSPSYHSKVLVKGDGLTYEWDYKWMGGSSFALKSEGELADKLSYAYLKELHAFIQSDKVWKLIGKELAPHAT